MNVNDKVTGLIGGVIMLFLVVSFTPTIYDEVTEFENTTVNETYTNESGDEDTREVEVAPTWLVTVLGVIIGAGLVFAVWRSFKP